MTWKRLHGSGMSNIDDIREIRNRTKLSLNECKKALEKTGSVNEACIYLQGEQARKIDKHKDKIASEGRIQTYVHNGAQLASIVEVNCETDFASKSEVFIEFCEAVAIQVVALQPCFISLSDVTEEQRQARVEYLKTTYEALLSSKPPEFEAEFIESKMKNWYREVCLLEQTSVIDQSKTINEMITLLSAQLGEKVVISRFDRWAIHG